MWLISFGASAVLCSGPMETSQCRSLFFVAWEDGNYFFDSPGMDCCKHKSGKVVLRNAEIHLVQAFFSCLGGFTLHHQRFKNVLFLLTTREWWLPSVLIWRNGANTYKYWEMVHFVLPTHIPYIISKLSSGKPLKVFDLFLWEHWKIPTPSLVQPCTQAFLDKAAFMSKDEAVSFWWSLDTVTNSVHASGPLSWCFRIDSNGFFGEFMQLFSLHVNSWMQ